MATLKASPATLGLAPRAAGALSQRRMRRLRLRMGTLSTALVIVALTSVAFAACGLARNSAPRATATVPPAATVPANALLDDPLTDNHNDWATNSEDSCYFDAADGFHVAPPGDSLQLCDAPIDSLTNGAVTVTVQQLTGALNSPYGIVFRGSKTLGALDSNTFYWFAIDSQGEWAVFRQDGSKVTKLSAYTSNSAIHTGLKQKNTLTVQFRGQAITCGINGVGVGVVNDPGSKVESGGVGLAAAGANAAFTDFIATS